MLGFIFSLIIASVLLVYRRKLIFSKIIVSALVCALFIFLLAKWTTLYPKEEVTIYRDIVKGGVVLYLCSLVNVLYIFMVKRVISFIDGGEKTNNVLFFYQKIYFSLYIVANILINYGFWLK